MNQQKTSSLVKFQPMTEILGWEDQVLGVIRTSDKKEFFAAVNSKAFVSIGGEMVNSRAIRNSRQARDSELASILKYLPEDQRLKIRDKTKSFKSRMNRSPRTDEIIFWIEKIKSGKLLSE